MADLPQEQLRVVLLDRRGRLIDAPLVYQGGQSETAVRLADCFREAVMRSAAAIVLVHNHPSGDPSPSPEDVQLTHDLLGIDLLDHVVLAHDGFVSLRAAGLYAPPGDVGPLQPVVDIARVPGWGYDCARCSASMRGLAVSTLTCERCLAPVTCRMLHPARGPWAAELARPAAA